MTHHILKKKFQMRAQYLLSCVLLLSVSVSSCKKFVAIDPPKTEIVREVVFTDDATANAAMVAVYVHSNHFSFTSGNYDMDVAYLCGKSADEMDNGFDGDEGLQFCENELLPLNGRVLNVWRAAYESVYRVNAILEGLENATGVTPAMKRQLEGEAKFIRAFNYFYLANLYGDVPLLTITDYRVNAVASRTAVADIYDRILKDLTDAQSLLPADYTRWSNERIRPVQAAATAMLSRVYLYLGQWAKAETEATKLITSPLFSIVNLANVFLKNNAEAIWQFYPPRAGLNSSHGGVAESMFYVVPLKQRMMDAFESGDNRRAMWTGNNFGFNFCFKYKVGNNTVVSEYTTNLRLAEQYLIRAEARAHQNDVVGAQEDIDKIRVRAGLSNTTADAQAGLLAAVEQERRIEFFAEYGHRWLDLKRWGKATAVLTPLKQNWQPADVYYPIPQTEIDKNDKLLQNTGY